MKEIHLKEFGIDITLNLYTLGNGSGDIISNLKDRCPYCGEVDCYISCSIHNEEFEDEDEMLSRRDYNSAIDGIESLVLAQAVAGIDVEDEKYLTALHTAIDACGNNP